MFAMYDDDGLNFRNSIDHLYNVHEIAPSQKLKNSVNDEDKNKQNFQESLYKGKITKEATNAYKQMNNLDTRVDIYHVEQIMSQKVITVTDDKTIMELHTVQTTICVRDDRRYGISIRIHSIDIHVLCCIVCNE